MSEVQHELLPSADGPQVGVVSIAPPAFWGLDGRSVALCRRRNRTAAVEAIVYPAVVYCFRFGGWRPPRGTPSTDIAVSMDSGLKPASSRLSTHLALASGVGSGIRCSTPIM